MSDLMALQDGVESSLFEHLVGMKSGVRRVFWLGAEIAHTAEETSANLTE